METYQALPSVNKEQKTEWIKKNPHNKGYSI